MRKVLKQYISSEVGYEVKECTQDKAVIILNKDNNNTYLIIRLAPNVHITSKDNF